jgi:hypothetical protein
MGHYLSSINGLGVLCYAYNYLPIQALFHPVYNAVDAVLLFIVAGGIPVRRWLGEPLLEKGLSLGGVLSLQVFPN